jgi:carbonic anhydrase/acetyltransferase-like protein (isoleucine patch superfamily)
MDRHEIPPGALAVAPQLHPSVFVARGAQVIGDVRLAAEVSVWYNAVLRGDINYISVGEQTNIQDGAILHVENDLPCVVMDRVVVGHRVILHGCTVESGCLIGMGAVVLSGARIGRGSVIAAGALIKENAVVEPFSLMAGVPAHFVRRLPESSMAATLAWAAKYAEVARLHQARGFSACPAQPGRAD